MKKINLYNLLNILILCLLIVLPYYIFSGKLFIGGDDTRLFYSYPSDFLKGFNFFSWVNNSTLGTNGESQNFLPFLSIWSILNIFIQNKVVLSYFGFSLPIILAFIYFKKFVRELFDLENKYKYELFLGSIFYIFSPILIYDQLFIFLSTVWLIAVIPMIGYYFLKYIKTSNYYYIFISLVLGSIFSFLALSAPWILGLLLPMFFGLMVLGFLHSRSEILTFFKKTIIYTFFMIFSQAFWLIGFLAPYFSHDKNSFASKFTSKPFLDTFGPTVLATSRGTILYSLLNLFNRQIAFDFNWKLKDVFVNFYDKTFFINLFVIVILFFGIFSFKKHLIKKSRKIFLFVLTSFITSLYFLTVNIGPLKDVFILMGRIPGFTMFRNFYDKFAPGYIFFYSVLITISLVLIKKRFPKKYIFFNLLFFSIIFINFIPIKETINSPVWLTNNIYRTITIPKEYLNFMNRIKANISPTNTILDLPYGTTVYTEIKDENSNNRVYIGVSPVKLFSGVNDISGDQSFNFTNENYAVDSDLVNRDYVNFNNFLYNYDINYVLMTKNLPTEILSSYVFYEPFLVKQDKPFLKAILNKKILVSSKGNYVLYSTKKQNILLSSQNLYFQKINPVKYLLYIKNIKVPQKLYFNDSYHFDWNLFLQKDPSLTFCSKIISTVNNTTECENNFSFFNLSEMSYLFKSPIFSSSHTLVNNFSNAWVIDPNFIKKNYGQNFYTVNKDGSINIELVLYFKQQLYFYYGLIITLIFILGSTIYLIKVYKKNEKNK